MDIKMTNKLYQCRDTKLDENEEKIEEGGVYSGEKFNLLSKEVRYVRLTTESENHNGFQYKTGLNVDHLRFDCSEPCSPGGLYFCRFDEFGKFVKYADKFCVNMRDVTIPNDAIVYVEYDTFKTDRFILGKPVKIFENYKLCLEVVNYLSFALYFVKNQTFEICIAAIKRNPCALGHVRTQTHEICIGSVKENGLTLEYVRDQTYDVCIAAVRQNPWALQYVKEQTREICLIAIKQDPFVLECVKNQTLELCIVAIKQEPFVLQIVKNQTLDLCLLAVKQNSSSLLYVEDEYVDVVEKEYLSSMPL